MRLLFFRGDTIRVCVVCGVCVVFDAHVLVHQGLAIVPDEEVVGSALDTHGLGLFIHDFLQVQSSLCP